jgi:hypothetical protein
MTYVVEMVFLVDIVVNFHTGYVDMKKCEVETDLARIRHYYLHRW